MCGQRIAGRRRPLLETELHVVRGGVLGHCKNHLDCNHKVGFAAPGPKSKLLHLSNGDVCSNAVEGAHSALFRLIKAWLGCKIGKGNESYELLVKDIGVCFLNWN